MFARKLGFELWKKTQAVYTEKNKKNFLEMYEITVSISSNISVYLNCIFYK